MKRIFIGITVCAAMFFVTEIDVYAQKKIKDAPKTEQATQQKKVANEAAVNNAKSKVEVKAPSKTEQATQQKKVANEAAANTAKSKNEAAAASKRR